MASKQLRLSFDVDRDVEFKSSAKMIGIVEKGAVVDTIFHKIWQIGLGLVVVSIISLFALFGFKDAFGEFFHATLVSIVQSLLVAGVMMIIIETISKKAQQISSEELIKKINKNLFFAVYRRQLDTGLVEEIEKSIFESKVFRMGHELTYTINPVNRDLDISMDGINHVVCEINSTYSLKNITQEKIVHPIRMDIELPIDSKWNDHCQCVSIKVDGVEVKGKAEERISGAQKIVTYNIEIAAGAEVSISTGATQIKRATDSEIWASRIPSNGMRLTLVTPRGDIETFAHANHRSDIKCLSEDSGSSKVWKLDQFILPHQSLVFWWKSKEDYVCK